MWHLAAHFTCMEVCARTVCLHPSPINNIQDMQNMEICNEEIERMDRKNFFIRLWLCCSYYASISTSYFSISSIITSFWSFLMLKNGSIQCQLNERCNPSLYIRQICSKFRRKHQIPKKDLPGYFIGWSSAPPPGNH